MDIRQRLLGVLQSVLGCDPNAVSNDDGPRTIAGWDSIAHLNLILAIEQEFGVHFDTSEIPNLMTVGTILARLGSADAD